MTEEVTETVGFIGLGSMGLPMARNVLDAGYRLRVYNRTPGKAAELLDRGAREVKTPAETVESGGIVITMLAFNFVGDGIRDAFETRRL